MSIRSQIRKLFAVIALFGFFGVAAMQIASSYNTSVLLADDGNTTRPTGGG